ncbi:MAG: pyridoxal-phosphate dependent enzyme, partial [Bilophila sp.]
IVIPTFAQMRQPELAPVRIKERLQKVGLWDLDPANLFRITWKNAPTPRGGGFGEVNHLVLPPALTGVKARIVVLLGKWFPTGAHKVGAAFGCLVPRLVTGQFDPITQKAAWPSTGNYCRGGAYDSALLGCASIAILPEGMSRERFDWLQNVAGQIIKTPGCESNVKEIFDTCWELRKSGNDVVIFNQFEEFGNYLWHYTVTGPAIEEVLLNLLERDPTPRGTRHIRGVVMSTGSGGTLASGDYIKRQYPWVKIAAAEALQCPTLLANGFGDHRIEGIGDKHVPWIHNVKNTDMIVAVDDEAPMSCIRLFNEEAGKEFLHQKGLSTELIAHLDHLGISGCANVLAAVKFAKHYELNEHDCVVTIATDSMDMYKSRLEEMNAERGTFTPVDAAVTFERFMLGQDTANMEELTFPARKRIHNLKYYTWVEQQGKTYKEILAQWNDDAYWDDIPAAQERIDTLITDFNNKVGLV